MPDTPRISRREFLKLAGLSLASFLLEPALSAHAAADPPVMVHGRRDLPFVALTFDDCYLFREMQRLEAILDNTPGLKVTFFPVGTALENTSTKDPDLWPRLYRKGHEFGYHSYDHTTPSEMNTPDAIADYDRWLEAVSRAIGETPPVRFARPPFGDRSFSFLDMCVARDLIVAMWSTDWPAMLDPNRRSSRRVEAGDVIIFHTRAEDNDNLPVILSMLTERKLHPLTMSELYHRGLTSPPPHPREAYACDPDTNLCQK